MTIMGFRLLRGGSTRGLAFDILLILGITALLFVYMRRYSIVPTTFNSGVQRPISAVTFNQEADTGGQAKSTGQWEAGTGHPENAIEARVRQIGDVRSEKCKAQSYSETVKESVSIIIDFNDYQFYNLKSTIGSLLHAGGERVTEYIIVDDGSTLQYIIEECQQYLANIPNVKLLRHRTQLGQVQSRMTGYREARSNIVVFLDVNVVVSPGWLEPLIDLLTRHPDTIAMPHYDLIHDPVSMEYRTTRFNMLPTWNWNLQIYMHHSSDASISQDSVFISAPAVHGYALAARKTFLDKIGQLDEGMESSGGEYLDLSLKTWLCDGAITVVVCSRVGVLNLLAPLKVKSRFNMHHLIQTYMGEYSTALLRLNTISSGQVTLPHRTNSILDLTGCKKINWYLQNIKNETFVPSPDVLHFGVLRVHSGRCARVAEPDGKVDLQPCPEVDPREQPIEMTVTGRLKMADGRCIATSPTAYMIAESCHVNSTRQEWRYTDHSELINTWSGFCARHVTDPDKSGPGSRQIAMAQACTGQPDNTKSFKQWSFINM